MNFEKDSWSSRGVVASACAFLALLVTQGTYGHIGTQDALCLLGLYAVALYGLIPVHVANWVFGVLCIILVCTLVIMFPVPTIALFLVLGALCVL